MQLFSSDTSVATYEIVLNLSPATQGLFLPTAYIVRRDAAGDLTHIKAKALENTIASYGFSATPERKQFLELPWKIYAGSEYWVPPIRMDQKEMVGYTKHPFYFDNEAQTFLAMRGSEPVGRISAIINNAHNAR